MPTSGVDIYTLTAGDIIKDAFVLINVVPATQAVPAADEAAAIRALNMMLQSWTMDGVYPWRKQDATFPPVQGQAEYNIVERPLEVIDMRWREPSGTEFPLTEISHDEYKDYPNKLTEGQPSTFYVRKNRTDTSIFLWPTPMVVTTELITLTYHRRTQIVTVGTEEIDLPQEWLETCKYGLAARLGDQYGSQGPIFDRVLARSQQLYEESKMYERVADQAFYPDDDEQSYYS